MKTGSTARLVNQLYKHSGAALKNVVEATHSHNVNSRARHGLSGGSTGTADCAFLYLLAKAFRRKSIFEIGSYIGSSALAMHLAVKGHGGEVITCDPVDYNCFSEGIRFINAPDSMAISQLATEGKVVDFVFADWVPNRQTIDWLNVIGDENLIFSAHDFLPGDKGEAAVELFSRNYRRIENGIWFLPEAAPVEVEQGLRVEQATAVFIPKMLLDDCGYQ